MKKEKKKKREKKERLVEEAGNEKIQRTEKAPAALTPLQYAVSAVGGKWKIRILWVLRGGNPVRYGEIKAQIPGITDMMLSQSLRELVVFGLVERTQYQVIPPRVEYRITSSGQELIPAMELLSTWAEKKMKG